MINWKISMSLVSFMTAGIELLKIKDHYNPNSISEALVYLVGAFIITIGLAFALLIAGCYGNFQRQRQRHHH